MTNNEILYLNYLETSRSNKAKEGETARHNKAGENISMAQVGIDQGRLTEEQRHNKANEYWLGYSNKESARHNRANENVAVYNAKETKRHNIATEKVASYSAKEQRRHNIATESIGMDQIGADYARIGLGYSQLAETTRSNQTREAIESVNANTAMLNAETARGSMINDKERNIISMAELEEKQRHNVQSETWDAVSSIGSALSGIARGAGAIVGAAQ